MFYRIARFLTATFYLLFYRIKYVGKENLPKKQQCIYVCNHLGKIDIVMLAYLVKHKIYFLSKKEWFDNKFLAWLFSKMGAIPIDRQGFDIKAIKEVLTQLKHGNDLGIFPEGTRNKVDNTLQPLKEGTSMFAFKSQVQIVPLFIYDHVKPFKRNYMYIGKPFDFSEYYGQKYDSELGNVLTEKIRTEMLNCQDALNKYVESKKRKK